MSRSRKKKQPGYGYRLLRWVFSPMRLCGIALLALGWLFFPRLEQSLPRLDDRPEFRVRASDIEITTPPRWIPEDIVEDAFRRSDFDESLTILDPKLCERVAFAFYTHPWIEKLKQVRKYPHPARVCVEVVYRRPVAMVEVVGGSRYPIDRLGHLLPNGDFSLSDAERYPIIKQISTPPMGGPGEAWGDPAVEGAAELASVLTETNDSGQSWWHVLGLNSIIAPRRTEVTDLIDDLVFRIGTAGGSEVVWGRYPGTQHPGELTVVKKLERMADYHRRRGFDRTPVAYQIDIRHWNGVELRTLAESPGTTRRE